MLLYNILYVTHCDFTLAGGQITYSPPQHYCTPHPFLWQKSLKSQKQFHEGTGIQVGRKDWQYVSERNDEEENIEWEILFSSGLGRHICTSLPVLEWTTFYVS